MNTSSFRRKTTGALSVLAAMLLSMVPGNRAKLYSGKKSIYEFSLQSIEGKTLKLADYKGKKMLLVNVASECGFTPQYKDLQTLHEKYGDKLVIIGFPSNNFGGQEPGSHEEIKSFCQKNYGVTFTITEKISVKGDDTHPLYRWLGNKEENGSCDKSPNWNFCKYLISEDGKIIRFFNSKTGPLSEEITSLL